MKKVKISIDSASDISVETAQKYGINLIPINITIGGKTYKDGIDIKPEEFFENLPNYSQIPKTSQVTVVEHMESCTLRIVIHNHKIAVIITYLGLFKVFVLFLRQGRACIVG